MKKETATLKQILKFTNGLNLMSNTGINLSIELSYELSLFKAEIKSYLDSYNEVIKGLKGENTFIEAELIKILEKEYEVIMPKISLEELKKSKVEVPLAVFDLISEQITK